MNTTQSHLRFVEADRLDTSAGRLNDVVILSPTGKSVGTLAGVMVDPADRHLRYYVIRSGRWWSRHYLVPLRPARLSGDAHNLEVDFEADELTAFERVDHKRLVPFTEDDLLAAMFRPHAA